MNCQYCRNKIWAFRGAGDSDFCSTAHRTRFHEHLRAGMQLIADSTDMSHLGLAPFHSTLTFDYRSEGGGFGLAVYVPAARMPGFELTPTAEGLAPELATSCEPGRADERIGSYVPSRPFAETVQPETGSDERPLVISAALAEVRQELAHRRRNVAPSSSDRKEGRLIHFPVAV